MENILQHFLEEQSDHATVLIFLFFCIWLSIGHLISDHDKFIIIIMLIIKQLHLLYFGLISLYNYLITY